MGQLKTVMDTVHINMGGVIYILYMGGVQRNVGGVIYIYIWEVFTNTS